MTEGRFNAEIQKLSRELGCRVDPLRAVERHGEGLIAVGMGGTAMVSLDLFGRGGQWG